MTVSLQPDRHDSDAAPAPYFLSVPDRISAPVIIMVPHSGRFYPPDFVDSACLPEQALRLSEDWGVDHLWSSAPAAGLPVIIASHGRAYVDLNRSPSDIDPTMFLGYKSTETTPNRRVEAGLGVIPRLVARDMPIYDTPLPVAEIAHRLDTVYYPYHSAVRRVAEQVRAQFGYVVLLDCHSMPSAAMTGGDMGRVMPDIVLGDNWGQSAGRRVTALLESLFIQTRRRVRRNVPYAGGFITEHYGRPDHGVHAVQIELCRSLYMDEVAMRKSAYFALMKADIDDIITALIARIDTLGLDQPSGLSVAAE